MRYGGVFNFLVDARLRRIVIFSFFFRASSVSLFSLRQITFPDRTDFMIKSRLPYFLILCTSCLSNRLQAEREREREREGGGNGLTFIEHFTFSISAFEIITL